MGVQLPLCILNTQEGWVELSGGWNTQWHVATGLSSDHWNVSGIDACHCETEGVKSQGVLPAHSVPNSCSWRWKNPRQQSHRMKGVNPHHTRGELPRRLIGVKRKKIKRFMIFSHGIGGLFIIAANESYPN